ncbi:hypothetical protein [Catenulispora rubra]|uniref:hypothetical protein n=1 Tax=Catenulispora rubra TaxID=280293 RepID=UPI0018920A68|nr:hypothetical protein [Catenulispora rubra]
MPDTMTSIARLNCQHRIDLWDPTDRDSAYELVALIDDMSGLDMLPWRARSFEQEDEHGNRAICLAVDAPGRVGLASEPVGCAHLLDNPQALHGLELAELLVVQVRAIGDNLIPAAEPTAATQAAGPTAATQAAGPTAATQAAGPTAGL